MDDLQPRKGDFMAAQAEPRGGRYLLPIEAELCNILNITAEEYLYFCQLSDAYNGSRAKEYEAAGVPDVVNIPVVPLVISLVVGVAATAIGSAMQPKPQMPKQEQVVTQQEQKSSMAPSIKTADDQGPKRFASISSFEGSQALAALGSVIPLVFANRRNGSGGIRAKLMLVWSQLLSTGPSQQMKAVFIAGMSRLGAKPDFDGYAIGELLLKSYTEAKLALYHREGGRISEADRYGSGSLEPDPAIELCKAYSDNYDSYRPMFCGTRSPNTQSTFGTFGAIANGQGFWVNYELVTVPISTKQFGELQSKQKKVITWWPTFCAVYKSSKTTEYKRHFVEKGDELFFVLDDRQQDPNGHGPWGLTDVNGIAEDRRIFADDSLKVGEVFSIGTAQATCIWVGSETPWAPGTKKEYRLRVTEPGQVTTADPGGTKNTWEDNLQRITTGSITNNRQCDQTEFGLKSTVWQQVNGFQNVNSKPSQYEIDQMQAKDVQIQLGNVQKYIKRYSFFKLAVRPIAGGEWQDLTNNKLFCVLGKTPQALYNYIRVSHKRGQYEFKFTPVPGSVFYSDYMGGTVYQLSPGAYKRIQVLNYAVTFSGQEVRLNRRKISNDVWFWGPPIAEGIGRAQGFDNYGFGVPPNAWRENYNDSGNREARDGEEWTSFSESTEEVWAQGGSGTGCKVSVKSHFQVNHALWTVDDTPILICQEITIIDGGKDYILNETLVISSQGRQNQVRITDLDYDDWEGKSYNVHDAIADIGKFEAQSFSHDSNPEHQIVYVNEQIDQTVIPQYDNLTLIGLRLNAGKEWTNFSQLTAYIKKGIVIERLIDDKGSPVAAGALVDSSNNLAEIVFALLTDDHIGAGQTIGRAGVDRERMQAAARFCHANGFTWDGIIADRLNLRSWIFEQAGFCLLDFTILGGQFALFPAAPYTSDFKIANNQAPQIKALFTDGNMRDLKVTWLSAEERKLFKAVVSYRDEQENAFSRVRTLTVWLSDEQGGSDADPEEQFDTAAFCTSREQALAFAKSALKLRREVDHGMIFETTPGAGLSLSPGDYVRVVSEVIHTSRFNNGSIGPEGHINCTHALADGAYKILYWKPGTIETRSAEMTVSDGKTNDFYGCVFTLITSSGTNRVFKVESIERSDEAFCQIALSHAPLTASGGLAVFDWNPAHFKIEES